MDEAGAGFRHRAGSRSRLGKGVEGRVSNRGGCLRGCASHLVAS